MIKTHTLGYPRIGLQRELKFALERHWRGEIDAAALEAVGAELRARHWAEQLEAGLDFVTVGDFAFYDHVANHIQLFGCEPARFGFDGSEPALARYFTLARGVAHEHADGICCGAPGGRHGRARDDQVVRHELPLPGAGIRWRRPAFPWPAAACWPKWRRRRASATRSRWRCSGP